MLLARPPFAMARTPGRIAPDLLIPFADKGGGEVDLTTLVKSGSAPVITFTRASIATTFDGSGKLVQVASDTPRSDYDPATGNYRGFLIEEARTNLCLRSEVLSATWALSDVTITDNQIVAPDGNTTADLVTEGSAGGAAVKQTYTATANATQTFSVFIKAGNVSWVRLQIADNAGFGNRVDGWFNIATGVAGSVSNVGTGTGATASIVNYGNGWYRCILSGAPNNSATTLAVQFLGASGDGGARVNGATYYGWGGQIENNAAFASSYIPTTTAAVTRSADSAIITDISGFFNATEGTIVAEFQEPNVSAPYYPWVYAFDNGTSAERLGIFIDRNSSQNVFHVSRSAPTDTFGGNQGSLGSDVARSAYGYKANDCAASVNGAAPATDSSVTLPVGVSTLRIGTGDSVFNGHIRRLAYWATRQPNAALQTLSA